MTCLLRRVVAAVALALCANVTALATPVDFEGYSDLHPFTNEIAGLTFANASVLTAGISLNEFEYPPRSGTNVVFDDGGSLAIEFAMPVTSILAYLSYASRVTLDVYDAGSNLVGTTTSLFMNNLALSGDSGSSPNEALSVLIAGGFSRAVFTGDVASGSFTLDDLTYSTRSNGVPEPSTLVLALLGLVALFPRRQRVCG